MVKIVNKAVKVLGINQMENTILEERKKRKRRMHNYIVSEFSIRGYGRALELKGTKTWPDISNNRRRDYMALRSDWENVGNTIREQIERYRYERYL